MEINECTGAVVDAGIKVHTTLGPGLLERAYKTCLAHELRKRGHSIATELILPVRYDGALIQLGYRVDLLVDECVVVEVKAVAALIPVHHAQLLSYLKLSGYKVGLLMNFHVLHLKDGIVRMVNGL